jgi:hypothetical protein
MLRFWWLWLLSGFIFFTVCLNVILSITSFHFRHPRYPQLRFDVTPDNQVVLNPVTGLKPLDGNGEARWHVESTVYDFGYMVPGTSGTHEFIVHNTGTGNLRLSVERSSCLCTVAQLPKGVIRPQESAPLLVSWHVPETGSEVFTQTIVLKTNDPHRSRLELTITGRLRHALLCEPAELRFNDLLPDETRAQTVTLQSALDQPVAIESVVWSSDIPGLSFHIEESADVKEGDVTGGTCWILVATAGNEIPLGSFATSLLVKARDLTFNRQFLCEIPVYGNRLGRCSVFGSCVDADRSCRMGTVKRGTSLTQSVTLRVRDPRVRSVEDLKLETDSPDLEAWLEVPSAADARPGLFILQLRVPESARVCNHLGPEPALVTVSLVGQNESEVLLRLPVRFAVVEP